MMLKRPLTTLLKFVSGRSRKQPLPVDLDPAARRIVSAARPYTMTSVERLIALVDAIRYVATARIPGDIVECGVWRGGSSMAAALSLLDCDDTQRTLYLYDTFEGMNQPGAEDRDYAGASAATQLNRTPKGHGIWCEASEADVRRNMESTGYPTDRIRYVRGPVEETIPRIIPNAIALLRLDTDWYDSTRHELHHLYPRLARGGVLIIDDYGHWQGARKAVDEYLRDYQGLYLHRVDYSCRLLVKT